MKSGADADVEATHQHHGTRYQFAIILEIVLNESHPKHFTCDIK